MNLFGDDDVGTVPNPDPPAPIVVSADQVSMFDESTEPADAPVALLDVPGTAQPLDSAAPPVDPEPDPDLPWRSIVGQARAVALLRAAVAHPVHAYLLTGPPGAGKQQAARAFGAAVLCPRGGCGTCHVCVRAVAGLHPDLLTVEREGASINVEQAREIIRLAMRSPLEGARKVLVLVDFHLVMNAGPTLLKVVEEPPESTVFVILAEHVPTELVTIASRCVEVRFGAVPFALVIETLVAEGIAPDVADRAARAAGGRLDRARLLAVDPQVGTRLTFWAQIPRRLDGTGAAVAVITAEAVQLLDSAAVGPLEVRQAAEVKTLDARLEAAGGRGGVGQRKELVERHKRELKRLRDDELRFGLTVLQGVYRDALVVGGPGAAAAMRAVARIGEANEALSRNPNLTLLLQSMLLKLPALAPAESGTA